MKSAVVFGIFFIFSFVVGVSGFLSYRYLNRSAQEILQASPLEVVYEVESGKTLSAVARELEGKGLLANAQFFVLFTRFLGEGRQIKRGEYLLRNSMTPHELLQVLSSGKSIGRNFTISEGLNIFEIAQIFEKSGLGTAREFLDLVQDPEVVRQLLGETHKTLEGYLFPETYQVTKYTAARDLISQMVARFRETYGALEKQVKAQNFSRHQFVTFASLVEKETGAPEEHPLVASVFFNRLKKGMMLQTDPTVLYAKFLQTGDLELNITRADLITDHEYNTYTRKGLPPGPIANPGLQSMKAVLNPAKSDYLFFVSRNDGTHFFFKKLQRSPSGC